MRRALVALLLVASPVWASAWAPAWAQTDSHAEMMDRLFSMLLVAPDEHAAGSVEGAIQNQWANAATPAVKLLVNRGIRELNANQPQDALDDFDAALDLQPDLIEGWRGRALARAQLGDRQGAAHDIEETIKREPRQFEALQDLSRLAESAGNWKGAYEAWTKVLAIDPKTPGGADRLKDLKRRAFGDET